MPEPSASVAEALSQSAIFHGVDPATVATVANQLQSVTFPRGHVLFAEGAPGDRAYVLIQGKVKIGRSAPDGRENLLEIMGPSDLFGELAIFDPGPRTSSATALTPVHAMTIDRHALRAWIREQPEVADQLLGVLARRLKRTYGLVFDMGIADVPGRVAKRLLLLADQFGGRRDGTLCVTHDLTQRELAQLVGATRETVNKVLGDFAQRGWIRIEVKGVLILDPERLEHRTRTGLCAHPESIVGSPGVTPAVVGPESSAATERLRHEREVSRRRRRVGYSWRPRRSA